MKPRESPVLSALKPLLAIAVLLGSTLWSTSAQAVEPWLLTGSLSGSTVLNQPYREAFGLGGGADVGLYRPLLPSLLIGGRLGGVLLAEERDLGQSSDHGIFTMARFAGVLRFRPLAIGADDVRRSAGLWLEAGAGPGFAENGSRLHAVLDAGLGYGFSAGAVTIGPALRYQQVIETEDSFGGRDARLASLGLEVTFGDAVPRPAEPAAVATIDPAHVRPAAPVAAIDLDRDHDGILDDQDRCDDQPETVNGINDHDGCPDTATLALVDDRLVIDEHVFFDFDQSVVSAHGRDVLRQIRDLYESNRWSFIRIEGYADSRGTDAYNMALGTRRTSAVRDVLIELGVPSRTMQAVSFGESAPNFVAAHTEAQHALNRRVEFVVMPSTADAQ